MMKTLRYALVALPIAITLAWATAVFEETPLVGGSGGTERRVRCGPGEVVVGFVSKLGMWLDGLEVYCDTVFVDGHWADPHRRGAVGSMQSIASTKRAYCPSDHVVKSFSVQAGSYVHDLVVVCNRVTAGVRTTPSGYAITVSDPRSYLSTPIRGGETCSEERPAVGIRVRSGIYVDAFGLICDYIIPGAPTLQSPVGGVKVTSKRPQFAWQRNRLATEPYKLCLSTSSTAGCIARNAITVNVDLAANTWTPTWTPPFDLKFPSGSRVYWLVQACNPNGCAEGRSSFIFEPQ